MTKMFSLIIPVYKQEKTIRRDLVSILTAMDTVTHPFEIIVVVDGEGDNSRNEALKVKDKRVTVVGYKTNHGKGYAVRFGFANANGNIIGFMDAGGDLKASTLPLMLEKFSWLNADIVIGSKRHPESRVHYPLYRRIMSAGYQRIIQLLFQINIKDSQVGMKIYRRKVLEDVLPRLLVKEFAFDIEILAVAYHLGYRKIYEAPVDLDFSGVISTVTPKKMIRIISKTFRDTLAVFYRLRILRYYDNTSIRKWRYDPELNFKVNVG